MKSMNVLDWVAAVLVIIGGLNWGLVGLFNFNLVSLLFGDMTALSRIVYVVVGLAAIYMIFSLCKCCKSCKPSGSSGGGESSGGGGSL